jgi:hypothetical protein
MPIINSGCTLHLTSHQELLHKYMSHAPRHVTVANNSTITSLRTSIIQGQILIDGKLKCVQIKNVQHVPEILHTLISPLQLEDNGLQLHWRSSHGVKFYQGPRLRLYSVQQGHHIVLPINLNIVTNTLRSPNGYPAALLAIDMDLHHQLGHACKALCCSHIQQSSNFMASKKVKLLLGQLMSCLHTWQAGRDPRPRVT